MTIWDTSCLLPNVTFHRPFFTVDSLKSFQSIQCPPFLSEGLSFSFLRRVSSIATDCFYVRQTVTTPYFTFPRRSTSTATSMSVPSLFSRKRDSIRQTLYRGFNVLLQLSEIRVPRYTNLDVKTS